MEYEKIGLNEIVPSDYNPRNMTPSQMKKLEKNLEKFGLVDPIIINLQNNHIIGGHQRYNILFNKYANTDDGAVHQLNLIRLGDIGWVFEDTQLEVKDENHEKALNLSLNRLDGEFDKEQTNNLISELTEAQFDLDLTGFEDYEIIEYSLDDFELNLSNDEVDDVESTENNNTEKTYSTNIHFKTMEDRKQFIEWLGTQRQENPDKKINQIIKDYLEENIQETTTVKVEPYYILHENHEEQKQFQELLMKLENNPTYNLTPIVKLIQNDK